MADQKEPQSKYAKELAALEDRQQAMTERKTSLFDDLDSEAMTEKKITGEKVRVEGPSPTYEEDKKFCPLCKRFVSPKGGNTDAAVVLGGTAVIGIFITWLSNFSLPTGTYNYYTGTTTVTFAEAVLSALLSFALYIFIILLKRVLYMGCTLRGKKSDALYVTHTSLRSCAR